MKSKILFGLVASLALAACTNTSSSSSGLAAQGDFSTAQLLANQVADSATSDIQNATSAGGVTTTQSTLPFAFAGVDISDSVSGAKTCVTVDVKSDTANDFDVVWTFACPTETGTVELSRLTNAAGATDTLDTDLKQTYLAGTLADDADDSLVVTKSSSGVLTLVKQFDDTLTDDGSDYESKGQANDSFTPDNAANPSAGGDVDLNSSLEFSKNGALINSFTVASTDLHISTCGFDSGSIETKSASDDIVVTYSACGEFSITVNGKLIFPLPNPLPSPTGTPPCGVTCEPGHACPQYCIAPVSPIDSP
jgi:hypothetical protein